MSLDIVHSLKNIMFVPLIISKTCKRFNHWSRGRCPILSLDILILYNFLKCCNIIILHYFPKSCNDVCLSTSMSMTFICFQIVRSPNQHIKLNFQDKQVTLETIDDFILSNADGNESRFLFAICHVVIKRRTHLRQHIKTIHLKVRNHVCSFCDAAFTKKFHRTSHEKKCKNRPQGQ